ncbi:MAG: filamentous hemagglutinin N-terminal domain-containing protein [Nitrosomonas sp.]|nr:filamentous hemagglutinin N-terminal domain-containing protein [Nitrosomonas sp.]
MRECYRCNWIIILIVAIAIVPVNSVLATNTHIQTDNSLSGVTGLSVDATGSNHLYTLSEVNGQVSGGNLFFSFSHFNIGSSDTAWFDLNTPSLANIISRVTGGSESVIDGQLRMTNSASSVPPSFLVINPAGVAFGTGASVDVPGSFYVSTASNLNLSDGLQYPVNTIHTNALSSANPESFGFLGNESGNLNIGSSETGQTTLAFNPGTDVAFVANHIHINNAAITNADSTRAGLDMQLIATGKDTSNIKLIDLPDQAGAGELTVQNATLNTSGNGSGRIAVRSGNFSAANSIIAVNNTGNISMPANNNIDVLVGSQLILDNSSIMSNVMDTGNGGSIEVRANFIKLFNDGFISTGTNLQGNAGDIVVSTNQLEILGKEEFYINPITFLAGITSRADYLSESVSTGSAGNVSVNVVDALKLTKNSTIHSDTSSRGVAGNVTINAGELELSSFSSIASQSLETNADGSDSGNSFIAGNAGDVSIHVDKALLLTTSEINSKSATSGNVGNVVVTANDAQINFLGGGIGSYYELFDTELNFANLTHQPGNVTVLIKDTLGMDYGTIGAPTFSSTNAGNVIIDAGKMEMSGSNITSSSARFLDKNTGEGNAGIVYVNVHDYIKLMNFSSITSSTYSSGNAGSVIVNARSGDLSDGSSIESKTGQSDDFGIRKFGNAGEVTVTIQDKLEITNGSLISTSTFSSGDAGNVTINAGRVIVSKDSLIESLSLPPPFISNFYPSFNEASSTGNTGDIDINVKNDMQLGNKAKISIENFATTNSNVSESNITLNLAGSSLYLDDSFISSVANEGNGGSINISDGNVLSLLNSSINTSVQGQRGNGGDINISSNALIMDTGFIQANTEGAGANGGKITIAEPTMIIPSSNFLLIGSSQEDFTPFSGRNVIQAVAPNGQSVPPVVGAPQLNLSGALANLNTESFGVSEINQNMCAVDINSSLLQSGKGGQRLRARDFLLSTMQ